MKVTELGHVALFVRDLEAALHFYRDLLGLRETGRGKGGRIAFLSAGARPHDIALEVARGAGAPLPRGAPGLYHIAFRVGRSPDDLAAARREVERQGLVPFGEMAGAAPSFCVKDPDGNDIELYVDPAG
ncbi:MAG: VOC family protein [Candidatus Rokubacteria bacterium]|nr:VOC family protein [Candidatus Rokubacteria bacterium]